MRRPHITLSIPEPCSEQWDNMQVQGATRFCEACHRNLTDYTGITDADLITLLLKQDGKICGRFHPNQLNRKLFGDENPRKKRTGMILSGILALSLMLPYSLSAHTKTPIVDFYSEIQTAGDAAQTNRFKNSTHNPPVIKGRVTDAETNEPILFASIRIEGTMIGSTSDVDGYFRIVIPEEADTFTRYTLIISSIGYENKQITVDKANLDQNIHLNLKLEPAHLLGLISIEVITPKKQNKKVTKNKFSE